MRRTISQFSGVVALSIATLAAPTNVSAARVTSPHLNITQGQVVFRRTQCGRSCPERVGNSIGRGRRGGMRRCSRKSPLLPDTGSSSSHVVDRGSTARTCTTAPALSQVHSLDRTIQDARSQPSTAAGIRAGRHHSALRASARPASRSGQPPGQRSPVAARCRCRPRAMPGAVQDRAVPVPGVPGRRTAA